jgi:hypothetical protein
MGNQRMEKSEELRLLFYLRICSDTYSTLIATNQVYNQRRLGLYRRPLSTTYSQSASFKYLLPLFIQTTTSAALQISCTSCTPVAG